LSRSCLSRQLASVEKALLETQREHTEKAKIEPKGIGKVSKNRRSRITGGPSWGRSIKQDNKTRFVRITNRRLPICLDPLGVLAQQSIPNLLQKICVSIAALGHGYCVHFDVVSTALAQRQSYSDHDYSEGDKLD
jgi:hypothetical protein